MFTFSARIHDSWAPHSHIWSIILKGFARSQTVSWTPSKGSLDLERNKRIHNFRGTLCFVLFVCANSQKHKQRRHHKNFSNLQDPRHHLRALKIGDLLDRHFQQDQIFCLWTKLTLTANSLFSNAEFTSTTARSTRFFTFSSDLTQFNPHCDPKNYHVSMKLNMKVSTYMKAL